MGTRRDDILAADRMQIGGAMLAPNRTWGEVSQIARKHDVSRRTIYDIAAKTEDILVNGLEPGRHGPYPEEKVIGVDRNRLERSTLVLTECGVSQRDIGACLDEILDTTVSSSWVNSWLATLETRAAPVTTIPTPQHPLTVDLTGSLRLLGYDTAVMSPPQQTTVRLTLHWQVLAPVGADYKVSARLLDEGGNQVAQIDDVPVHNTYPTSRWKAGETITDVYDLTVPPDTSPGQYRLLVILYDPATLAEVGRAELGTVRL